MSIIVLSIFMVTGCLNAHTTSQDTNASTQYNDEFIEDRGDKILSDHQDFSPQSNIEFVVYHQVVLLLGEVPDQSVRTKLAKQIAHIPGVVKVYNQLAVGQPASFSDYLQDSWITTKVITALTSEGISANKFKVVTKDGTVYMMGYTAEYEGNRAANITSQVDDVKKVIKLFTYINPNIQH